MPTVTPLMSLWFPILLSAVIVFVVSSVIHMASPWHKNDYPKLANEDAVLDALRPLGLPPGDYFMPRPASREEMKSPAFAEKTKRGPVVLMTIFPSAMPMARNMVLWFLYAVVNSIFGAYLAGRAVGPGAHYLVVFRFVGAACFLGYALALWQMSIWYGRSLTTTTKATIDGLIYALLTAGTFGWLWPR